MAEVAGGARGWSVDAYRPGDEHEILALFNSGFGQARTLATWYWRFRDNPLGGPLASVARRDSDGRLVGTYMCLPFRLNVSGRALPAAQVVDLVVHPDHRRQGMFERMARHSYEQLGALGYRAEVAFPNPTAMSYPGFTRTLGWSPLSTIRRTGARLDLGRPLRRLLRLPWLANTANATWRVRLARALERRRRASAHAGFEFRTSTAAPEGCDRLWDACRESQGLSFWKDAGYLRWRYDANPDHDFTYGCLTRAGELVALAVALERDDAVILCELLVAGRDPAAGRGLVAEMCGLAFRRRMRSISYYGHDDGYLASVLEGFSTAREAENVLVGHPLAGDARVAMSPAQARWTIAYGDADFV